MKRNKLLVKVLYNERDFLFNYKRNGTTEDYELNKLYSGLIIDGIEKNAFKKGYTGICLIFKLDWAVSLPLHDALINELSYFYKIKDKQVYSSVELSEQMKSDILSNKIH